MADVDLVVGADVSAVERAARQAKESLRKIGDGAGQAARGGVTALGGAAERARTAFAGMRGEIAGMVVGAVGIAAVNRLVSQGVKSAQEYARALKNLRHSLEGIGKVSSLSNLQGFIGSTEARTGIDDSKVAQMLAEVIAAGETDVENAKRRVQLALDIEAKGYGAAESALSALTKAGAENELMLRRMATGAGIVIDKNASLQDVIDALSKKTAGAAEAMQKAGGGAAALSVAWDNTIQTMGENFMGAWGPVIDKLTDVLDWYNDPYSGGDAFDMGERNRWIEDQQKPEPQRDKTNAIAAVIAAQEAKIARGTIDEATGRARINAVRAAAVSGDAAGRSVLVKAMRGVFDDNDGGSAVTGAPRAPGGGSAAAAAATSLLPGQAPAAAAAISLKISAPQGTRATVAGATR